MEWNCWLRVLALFTSAGHVFPFAFKDDMPLLSCFYTLNIVSNTVRAIKQTKGYTQGAEFGRSV